MVRAHASCDVADAVRVDRLPATGHLVTASHDPSAYGVKRVAETKA